MYRNNKKENRQKSRNSRTKFQETQNPKSDQTMQKHTTTQRPRKTSREATREVLDFPATFIGVGASVEGKDGGCSTSLCNGVYSAIKIEGLRREKEEDEREKRGEIKGGERK